MKRVSLITCSVALLTLTACPPGGGGGEDGVTSATGTGDGDGDGDGDADSTATNDSTATDDSTATSDSTASDSTGDGDGDGDGFATQVSAGGRHTCALGMDGTVRCWGRGTDGQLGYMGTSSIGDDEHPSTAGGIQVGGVVEAIATGANHSCAMLTGSRVRCWGASTRGQLGYANTNSIGDNETPAAAGDVNVGGIVSGIAAGGFHTCALLSGGEVRCWGQGTEGQLGQNSDEDIGDDETPSSAGDINTGGIVTQLSAGERHTCGLMDSGQIRCWGWNSFGQLGYGDLENIGDDETPSTAGDINVGGVAIEVQCGQHHTCAVLEGGAVRCWGRGEQGRLGYGNVTNIGDNEDPAAAGSVALAGNAIHVSLGDKHTCAALDNGDVLCWGWNGYGQLGYGNFDAIGDNESPATAGTVDVGSAVANLGLGGGGLWGHGCALMEGGAIRCWGNNEFGQLGYANTQNVGDDEDPADAGDVQAF